MAYIHGKWSDLTLVYFFILIQANFIASKLSEYTTICNAQDPQLNECVKKSAMEMINNISKGIPDLGIPIIEPFQMPNTFLDGQQLGFSLSLSDIKMYDFSKAVVTDVRSEPAKFSISLNLYLQRERILGTYKIKGKVYVMPIHGSGRINVTLSDVNIAVQISGQPEIRGGVLYMKLKDVSVSIEPKKAEVYFDNLFNGNKMLGAVMNNVVNNNWQEMYNPLKPKLEQLCRDEIFKLIASFLSRTPYHQMFHDLNL